MKKGKRKPTEDDFEVPQVSGSESGLVAGVEEQYQSDAPLPKISNTRRYKPGERQVRMERFMAAYQATFGNVSQACIAADISLSTYYAWRQSYPEFKEMIDGMKVEDVFVDWVESKLVSKIKAGDTASIIFALKTKGRKRGWEEKVTVDSSQPQVVFNLVMPERKGVNMQNGQPLIDPRMQRELRKIEEAMDVDDADVVNDSYGVNQEKKEDGEAAVD